MRSRWLPNGRKLVGRALWSVPVIVTVKDCLLCPEFVEGRSMQPTLNPDPDRSRDLALVFKFGVLRYKYDRGAIYLLRWESLLELVSYTGRNSLYDHDKSPEHPRKLLAKRLIGLEGDWVAIPGEVSIQRIQKGFCWVEGDNNSDGEDSRGKFGQIPISLLEGKIVGIMWPPHRISRVLGRLPPERLLITNSNAFQKV